MPEPLSYPNQGIEIKMTLRAGMTSMTSASASAPAGVRIIGSHEANPTRCKADE